MKAVAIGILIGIKLLSGSPEARAEGGPIGCRVTVSKILGTVNVGGVRRAERSELWIYPVDRNGEKPRYGNATMAYLYTNPSLPVTTPGSRTANNAPACSWTIGDNPTPGFKPYLNFALHHYGIVFLDRNGNCRVMNTPNGQWIRSLAVEYANTACEFVAGAAP